MKSAEFIRRVRRYAKRHGLEFAYDPRRGKGSHGRLYLGDRLTTVKSGNKTIGKGLLLKMLKDLNIDFEDF
jgi:mRNA interferase HicA